MSRFQKRIYLKLPDKKARKNLINNEIERRNSQKFEKIQLKKIVQNTENYSYRDFKNLFKDVDQIIIKKMNVEQVKSLKKGDLLPVKFELLELAIQDRDAITTNEDIKKYELFSPKKKISNTKKIETESSSEEEHGFKILK